MQNLTELVFWVIAYFLEKNGKRLYSSYTVSDVRISAVHSEITRSGSLTSSNVILPKTCSGSRTNPSLLCFSSRTKLASCADLENSAYACNTVFFGQDPSQPLHPCGFEGNEGRGCPAPAVPRELRILRHTTYCYRRGQYVRARFGKPLPDIGGASVRTPSRTPSSTPSLTTGATFLIEEQITLPCTISCSAGLLDGRIDSRCP